MKNDGVQMSSSLGSNFDELAGPALISLNQENLGQIKETTNFTKPSYPLEQRKAGIVHFGPGNFSAAHLGIYADDLLAHCYENNLPLDYGVIAVSPRVKYNEDGHCAAISRRDQLAAQDYLYTVAERYGEDINTRVVGSLMGIMIGPEDREAVYEILASPDTKIVTGTVTQKGYTYDPKTPKEDQFAHYVYKGQALRFERGLPPLAIVSLDNMPKNSESLRTLVETFAALDNRTDIVAWLEKAPYYNTMVDRIVPAGTLESRDLMRDKFGILDSSVIACEPYKELVIGYDQNEGECPVPFDKVGAQYSSYVDKHADIKQEMLNGGHFFTGVVGRVRGETYIEEALTRPGGALFSLVDTFMKQVQPTLEAVPDRNLDEYRTTLLERFVNPEPKDPLQRLARNGTDKVGKRLFNALEKAYEKGLDRSEIVTGIAHWIVYMSRANDNNQLTKDTGNQFYIEDETAYKQGYVGLAKSLNGLVSPMFSLPLFEQTTTKPWGSTFRRELQVAYTDAIQHRPSKDILLPPPANDKNGPQP